MSARGPDAAMTTAFVHTHGTRLVRLARLLGNDRPAAVAADALAATLRKRNRHGDAHDALLSAARGVGARSMPEVRDDARLQGWLDRAELESYDVDHGELVAATRERLHVQSSARRRRLRRMAAGAALVAILATAGVLWPEGESVVARRQVEGSGILVPNDLYLNGGDPNAVIEPGPPPRRQRVARDVRVAGVVLTGPTTTVMQTSLAEGPATLLAVGCTAQAHLEAICVVRAPAGVALPDIAPEAVVAFLPSPESGEVLSTLLPTVLRGSLIGTLASQTLLLDVTSAAVDEAFVTYTDGSRVLANRYVLAERTNTLFVARNKDVMPASVTYLDSHGRTLGRRSLYTTTS